MKADVQIRLSGYQIKRLLADYILKHYNIKVEAWQIDTEVCSGRQLEKRKGTADFVFQGTVEA